MGVCIECKKTGNGYDLGYGGFTNLRTKIAKLCCPEFGEIYANVYNKLHDDEYDVLMDQLIEPIGELISNKKISPKVIDFCFQSDADGAIRYGACKEILKGISGYEGEEPYGYVWRMFTIKDFANLLQECVDNKCDLVWR